MGTPLEDLVYPPPPDIPRIKYIKTFSGDADLIEGGSMVTEVLLGSSGRIAIGKPMGIHASGDGRLYVTDTAKNDVYIFDLKTKTATTVSTVGDYRRFSKPVGAASDKSGRLFVSDSANDNVTVFDKDMKSIGTLLPDTPFKQPVGIAIDSERKKIYVVDTHEHHVRVFDLETLKQISVIGGRGRGDGAFNYPSNAALDSKGNLYVVDTQNGRVQKFDTDGRFILRYGEFGDAPGMFARPRGVAIDSEDHVYVVDAAFNVVQIFDSEGQILMSFGSYGSGRGNMILPAGIAIDKDDFIYVVDSINGRVVVFEYLGDKHKAREEQKKAKKG
ncbi:MAG: 6-bladed beta-propeller [Deltaproteobacteria bacterium]|nr:6-bladed beta-propeller [Deltaproteobacteria bacterium]